jgi:transposase
MRCIVFALERIGKERSATLHYEPSKLTVIEYIRFKYVAKKDGESTIVTASAQPTPLPKSNASASLHANMRHFWNRSTLACSLFLLR